MTRAEFGDTRAARQNGQSPTSRVTLYDRAAAAYDLTMRVAHEKDYRAEADEIAALVRSSAPRARSLLDVACGNGRHLARLAKRFRSVEGIELSPAMVGEARRLHPGLEIHRGDMRDFQLGRSFDAVTCLFGSIGYMTSARELKRAIANMAAHLSPGGVLVLEGWFGPQAWESGRLGAEAAVEGDLAVCRAVRSTRRGRLSEMEMHYLVATPGGIEHVVEIHRMGLFTPNEYRHAMKAAGLRTRTARGLSGRGLYIGVAPLR